MTNEKDSLINVDVTFRHTESTPALKTYATQKVTHALSKYVQYPAECHVVLEVEKQSHRAEVSVHSKNYDLTGRGVTDDLYSAIDKMVDNMVSQLRKQKERQLSQKQKLKTKEQDAALS